MTSEIAGISPFFIVRHVPDDGLRGFEVEGKEMTNARRAFLRAATGH